MWCEPTSYSTDYVRFCVPWILEVFTNNPCAGTTNDCLLLTSTLHLCRYMLYMQAMILMRSYRLQGLAVTSIDGCCLTSSSTIVYCMVPGCKDQHANLAGQHQKK